MGDQHTAVRLARQAGRITTGIPGSMARGCSYLLAIVLTGAGDLAEAERVCAAGLAQSREADDLWNQAGLLTRMVTLDVQAGRIQDAAVHLQEGFQLAMRTGSWDELVNSLDSCGHLCAATGRFPRPITVWAAPPRWSGPRGFRDCRRGTPPGRSHCARPGRRSGPSRARVAEERGAAMSLDTAAEYALLLTAPGPQQPRRRRAGKAQRPGTGTSHSGRPGRTDTQIATQLYISVRTVRSHLDRIRDKTGCRRRADLTRLALTAGLI